MNKIFSLFTIFLIFCTILTVANAQVSPIIQLPQYNLGAINPAFRPTDNNFDLVLSSQTHGLLQDAPINDRRLFSGSIYKKIPSNNLGFGLVVNQVSNARIRNTSFGLSGNYAIGSDAFTLSFGLNAGFIQSKSEDVFGDLRHEDDEVFANTAVNETGLQINTGALFFTEKTKISFSIKHLGLIGKDIGSNDFINRNYLLFVEHDVTISENLELQPILLTQFVQSRNDLIFRPALSAVIREAFTIGIQYETIGFLGFNGKINLYQLIPSLSENIQLFFLSSHAINDPTLSEFGSRTELGISYKFNFRPNYKKVLNEKIIDSPVEYRN